MVKTTLLSIAPSSIRTISRKQSGSRSDLKSAAANGTNKNDSQPFNHQQPSAAESVGNNKGGSRASKKKKKRNTLNQDLKLGLAVLDHPPMDFQDEFMGKYDEFS